MATKKNTAVAVQEDDNDEPKPIQPPRDDLTPDELKLIPKIDPHYKIDETLKLFIGHDLKEKLKVCLTGHTGCGKTSLFLQLAAQVSKPVIRVNLNGQTTVSDLVGYNTVIDGNIVWIDGVLTLAMRRGYWIIFDEMDAAEPEVLFVLNGVAEENGFLTLKEKGSEIVWPHKSFRMLATANTIGIMEEYRTLYQGAKEMNTAFIDRFRVYHMTYMKDTDEQEVLVGKVPGCPEEAAVVLVRLANEIRAGFEIQEIDRPFSTRALIDLTRMMMRVRSIEAAKPKGEPVKSPNEIINTAVEMCLYSKVSRKDAKAIGDLVAKISITE